jgi:predicted GNAT superfamily acetyltransferase
MRKALSPEKGRRVRIRELNRIQDCRRLPDVQLQVWGHSERDLTPAHQYLISTRMGGILLGAFVNRELAGFAYSFPAIFNGELIQHSHHLGVLPRFQGYGIGKALKWAQRDWALKQGFSRITWTFDPLQAKNAHLNFHALGGICRTYLPNFYGMGSALNLGPKIPTDRLLMEWLIRDRRLKRARQGDMQSINPEALAKALEKKTESPDSRPASPKLSHGDKRILAEMPPNIRDWREKKRHDLIAAWQTGLRRVLTHYFDSGYAVVDFIYGDGSFYVLERRSIR